MYRNAKDVAGSVPVCGTVCVAEFWSCPSLVDWKTVLCMLK